MISHHQRTILTYDALDRDSNKLARGLQNLGVRKGERVAVSLGNNVEFATVWLWVGDEDWVAADESIDYVRAVQAGGYPGMFGGDRGWDGADKSKVPLNPAFNAPQVLSALNHLAASHLIIGAETNLPRKDPRSNISLLTHLIPNLSGATLESELVPSLQNVVLVDNSAGRIDVSEYKSMRRYEHVVEDGAYDNALEDQGLDPNEIANIQFTSGTTSMPKAACLSHRSILNNGNSIGDRMLLTPDDVVCCPPPLFQYLQPPSLLYTHTD